MENNKKKVTAIVLGIFALVAVTMVATYAFFTYTRTGTTKATITSGDIEFSYFDSKDNATLTDAFPVSDSVGAIDTKGEYKFSVRMKASANTKMNYNLYFVTNNTGTNHFTNDQIKYALLSSDSENGTYEYLNDTSATKGNLLTTISGLTTGVSTGEGLALQDVEINSNEEHFYKLRIWISDTVDYSNTVDGQDEQLSNGKYNGYTYSLKVKVTSGISNGPVISEINLYDMMKTNASNEAINFSVNSKTSGTNGIYTTTATEGNVPVYYYRGAANQVNNNVIFNNMCWKIIRTTETGGVKLIYNGLPVEGKCETQTGETTQIGTSAFNTKADDNAYVGYMYGTAGSTSYAATHANTNESTIKKESIDPWFEANFDETATSKLEDTVFCNDRSTTTGTNNNTLGSSYGSLGYGKNTTAYGAAARSSYYTNVPNPSLVCTNANDKFTVSSANGNGKLSNPVGLITLDEVVLAGYNTYQSNTSDYINDMNYLHVGKDYWTLSPINVNGDGLAGLGRINILGTIGNGRSSNIAGVRPVVSLKSGTMSEGEGTTTNPYVVK